MILPLQFSDAVNATEKATSTLAEQGILGSIVVILFVGLIMLYISNNKKEKVLRDKVDEVTKNHIETIKEASKDSQMMIEKYHQFANEIKALFHQQR